MSRVAAVGSNGGLTLTVREPHVDNSNLLGELVVRDGGAVRGEVTRRQRGRQRSKPDYT